MRGVSLKGKPGFDLLGGLVSIAVISNLLGYIAARDGVKTNDVFRDLTLGGDTEVLQNNLDALEHLEILELDGDSLSLKSGVAYTLPRPLLLEAIEASEEPGVKYFSECIHSLMKSAEPVRVEEILRSSRQKYGVASPGETLSVKKRFLAGLIGDFGLGIRVGTSEDPSMLRVVDPSTLDESHAFLFPKLKAVGIHVLLSRIHEKLFPCLQSEKALAPIETSILALRRSGRVELGWEADAGPKMVEDPITKQPYNMVKFLG